jgi:hypothetical protein
MHSDAGLQHGPTFTAITSALAILKLMISSSLLL